MPRAFTERERDLIRQRLLDEGDRLFSALGLRKASVEDIARAARISKGAFYLFFDSKEALFMEVAERAEQTFRREVLAALDLPASSPRARVLAVLRTACSLFRTIPLLRAFTGTDFDLLLRALPPERLRAHLDADRSFFEQLLARCEAAGIPIRAGVEEIRGLLYTLVLIMLREQDPVLGGIPNTTDILAELIAAYCVGEVEIQPVSPAPISLAAPGAAQAEAQGAAQRGGAT
jgi:AcrR family transcriptional regulator